MEKILDCREVLKKRNDFEGDSLNVSCCLELIAKITLQLMKKHDRSLINKRRADFYSGFFCSDDINTLSIPLTKSASRVLDTRGIFQRI